MFGRSLRLTRIMGIPIGLHPSLLILLFVLLVWFTGDFKEVTGNQTTAFILAAATALGLLVSILLHELGHAAVAKRNKIGIAGIDLWMLGGVAKLKRDADSAGVEFRIAVAGPAVTLVIAAALVAGGVAAFGSTEFFNNFPLATRNGDDGLLALVATLASINAILLVFNLAPAFPLDGGRIARALAWKVTGDRASATKIAATLGQILGLGMIGLGILIVVAGGDGALVSGVWLAFIGWMITDAARAAVQQTQVLSKIEGMRVEDVMEREPIAVPGKMTIDEATHEYFLRYRYPWFPVVDRWDKFIGVVEADRAERIPVEKQTVFKVEEIMRAEGDKLAVPSNDPLEALLANEPLRRLGALMAVDHDGRLTGIVTVEQIMRALEHGLAR